VPGVRTLIFLILGGVVAGVFTAVLAFSPPAWADGEAVAARPLVKADSVLVKKAERRLLLLKGGRALFIEVKRPGGKATRLQEQFLDRARAAGALAAVVDDPQQIVDLLR